MTRVCAVLAGGVIAAVSAPARAGEDEPVVEKLEHGEVNWTKKTVMATGSGAPDLTKPNVAAVRLNAERAAQINAYRNVLETLKGVKISAQASVSDSLGDPQIKAQVQGVIQGCKTVDTRYYSDGGVDVVIKCSLDGGLSTVLAPVKDPKPIAEKGEKKHTGLIIDAVGIKVQPAISPRIIDEGGTAVYTREMVLPSVLRQNGAATYTKTVDSAKHDPRVGQNPLVVKATAVGSSATDVVISKEEAAKLQTENLYFLAEAHVVIATDGP